MASIVTEPNGRRLIQFIGPDGKRKKLRLGNVSKQEAATAKLRIAKLLSAKIVGTSPDDETSRWLAGRDEVLYGRLVRVGLATPRKNKQEATVGGFIRAYIDGRTDVKPRTLVGLAQGHRWLCKFFGANRSLASVTAGEAEDFRVYLLGEGLAENTVRRNCGRARQFWHAAIRRELVSRNPFAGLKTSVGSNPSRRHFVTRAEAERVIAACPDTEWRLIFAICRYAGLRCPSELRELRWADVDWQRGRFLVHSPKTEHYEGKASREVPIFPELLPYMREAFEAAEPGAVYLAPRCRISYVNLGTQLGRIIRRAGLTPWPKLFHNLRATRETELTEDFPLHVVCAWIGNSPTIAAKHYLQVTEDHFARAVQNPVRQGRERGRTETKHVSTDMSLSQPVQELASACVSMPVDLIAPPGFEPGTKRL